MAGLRLFPLAQNIDPHFRVESGEYLGVVFIGKPDTPIQLGHCVPAQVVFVYAPDVNYADLQVGSQF